MVTLVTLVAWQWWQWCNFSFQRIGWKLRIRLRAQPSNIISFRSFRRTTSFLRRIHSVRSIIAFECIAVPTPSVMVFSTSQAKYLSSGFFLAPSIPIVCSSWRFPDLPICSPTPPPLPTSDSRRGWYWYWPLILLQYQFQMCMNMERESQQLGLLGIRPSWIS